MDLTQRRTDPRAELLQPLLGCVELLVVHVCLHEGKQVVQLIDTFLLDLVDRQTSHVREVSSGEVVAVRPGCGFVVEGAVLEAAVGDGDEAVRDDS